MKNTNRGKRLILSLVAVFALSPSFATEGNFFGEIGEFLNNLDIEFTISAPIIQQPTVVRRPTVIQQPVTRQPVTHQPVIQRPVVIQRPIIQQPIVRYIPIQPQQPRYIPIQPRQLQPRQPSYIPYNGGTYGGAYGAAPNSANGYTSQVTVTTTPYGGATTYAPVTNNGYTTIGYSDTTSHSGALSNGYFNLQLGEGYIVGNGMAMTLLDIDYDAHGNAILVLAFSYGGQTRHVRVGLPQGEQPILKVGGKRMQLVGLERNHGSQYVRCYLTD